MARTLILDLGNVIACFDHGRACRQLAALSTRPLTEAQVFEEVFRSGLEGNFDRGAIDSETFLASMRARFGLDAADAAIARAWSDIFWPNPPMIDLVRRADEAGLRLVLASNTNPLHFAQVQRQFGDTLVRFDALVLSYEIGCRKPDRAFFERCLAVADAPARACLYVDDREDFVEAGRALGLPGVVCTPGTAIPWGLVTGQEPVG